MRGVLFIVTGVALLCLEAAEGRVGESTLFGYRSPRQDAVGDVKQNCVNEAHRGSCEFFVCFEERHPCETHNYALDYGWRFCSRFDHNRRRMTEAGQRWLNGSMHCTMERLLSHYLEPSVVCTSLAAEMRDAQAACEVENGLCSGRLLMDNREVFTDVHTLGARSATQFLHAVKHCTVSKAQMVAAWFRDRVSEVASLPAIQELRAGLALIQNDIRRELSKIGRFFTGGNDDDEDEDANDWSSWDNNRRKGFGVDFDVE